MPEPAEAVDPRVARTREAVLAAVRRLVRDSGIEGVTHQRVAEEADVGRASVYRHWPERVDLLLDALGGVGEPGPWSSSGSLEQDLERELRRLQGILNSSPLVPELIALIGRAEWEPALRALKQQLLGQGTNGLRRSLEEGIARGELPSDLRIDDALATLAGPLFFQRLLADRGIHADFVRALVAGFVRCGTERPEQAGR
jgi:AcrR family transcriptional regulator